MNQSKLATLSAHQRDLLTDALLDDPVARIQAQGAKNQAEAQEGILEALAGGSGQAAIKASSRAGSRGLTKVETMQLAASSREQFAPDLAEPDAERPPAEASAHASTASDPFGEPAANPAAGVALAPPTLALLPMG